MVGKRRVLGGGKTSSMIFIHPFSFYLSFSSFSHKNTSGAKKKVNFEIHCALPHKPLKMWKISFRDLFFQHNRLPKKFQCSVLQFSKMQEIINNPQRHHQIQESIENVWNKSLFCLYLLNCTFMSSRITKWTFSPNPTKSKAHCITWRKLF